MKNIISRYFVNALQVTDQFHVQKLADQAVQDIRVQERWKALDLENSLILQAKKEGRTFIDKEIENGDTTKQLLIRSRYLLINSEIPPSGLYTNYKELGFFSKNIL